MTKKADFDLNNERIEFLINENNKLKLELVSLRAKLAQDKTTAEYLKEAMDSSSDMVVLYDKHEKIVFTNARYHEIYPHSPPKDEIINYTQEQLLRRSLEAGQIDHPLARSDPEAWIKMRLEQRRQAIGGTNETQHSNGRIYQFSHHRTSDGGTFIFQTDITDIKRIQTLHSGRSKALEMLAGNAPLSDIYPVLIDSAEKAQPGYFGAIYMADENAKALTFFCGPNLPDNIKNRPSADNMLPTKVHIKIMSGDIYFENNLSNNPDWTDFKDIFIEHNISSCVISPILIGSGEVIGALSLYHRGGVHFKLQDQTITDHTLKLLSISYERVQAINAIENSRKNLEIEVDQRTRQLKESEEKALNLAEKAEQANQAKSSFLAAMSHELRTPMSGLIGMSELLLKSPLSPEQKSWASYIENSGQNLMVILNEILDQAKLEAGKFILDPIDFQIRPFIDDTVELFKIKIDQKKLGLNIKVDENFPTFINADRLRIGQILSNLLSNALKFTEKGFIEVRASNVISKSNQPNLLIEVIDTGIGVESNAAELIFQPFSQADSSTSRKYGGTGLGLSISKKLAELMEGEIGVSNNPDGGSIFYFSIPYQLKQAKNQKETIQSPMAEWEVQRILNILVAEDNQMIQRLILAMFEKLGHIVTIVDNGMLAVEKIENEKFDLVLMDIRMPVMDGIEATKKIRTLKNEQSAIPIIALTADIASDNITEYLQCGLNEVCGKPIDLPNVLKSINTVFRQDIHKIKLARKTS